jgi:hypothetical protein
MKYYLLTALISIAITVCNAQVVNNKPFQEDRETIQGKDIQNFKYDGLSIYWVVADSSKDLIKTKNYVQNSDNFFELNLNNWQSDSVNVVVVDYSPKNSEFKRIINYTFLKSNQSLKFENYRQTVVTGISYPTDFSWIKELGYHEKLDEEVYRRLVANIIKLKN